ncbi:MAG TPA: cobalamin-independent methionine synthase II family protein [Trebonia sp.]|jgi:5-methyltetrahydropteroyltriglutamate--homocysteine methyltransferase|nr:cobalamin-independent methionine synthase II family protein [Trebonia sp.]
MTETKFRADHVGSLLRPERLLAARRRREAGEIDDARLRAIEDAAIEHAVARQIESGIDVVTDGEFRRRDFRTGFVDAVDGFTMSTWDMPWRSGEGVTKVPSHTWVAAGRLRPRGRLAAGEASHLLGLTAAPAKVTLIAPGFLEDRFWKDGVTDQFYSSREEFAAEVAAITRAEIEALITDGVRYIQIDNPGYGAFLGARPHGDAAAFERMLATDVAAVAGVERPPGVTIGFHVCRGNQSSMWMGEGDYEPIAERTFGSLPVDRFLLEYDDERAGGFAPLRFAPSDKVVVLGLVSSKTATPEEPGELRRRIDEAAKFTDLDRLALSPQCGFASIAEGGNLLTPDEQYAKLALVAQVARTVWGD